MRLALSALILALALGCGGGGTPAPSAATDPWAAVTQTIQAAQPQFPGGLCVEVATPAGVVYSRSFGGFTNQTSVLVASGSKWVTSTVILRLVAAGAFPKGLDTPTRDLLVDAGGVPWSGPMGDITLRHLLSFTSGITGDHPASENPFITLRAAVDLIYADLSATASAPGSLFHYGSTHMRIAARMAEVATGKTWAQIFGEQLHDPMGWAADSLYSGGGPNPNPAGGLKCTGQEYLRFLVMQLRNGLDGTQVFLPPDLISAQRTDGFTASTTLGYSPYVETAGWTYHYALGNWLETAAGGPPGPGAPVLRHSSTGTFGWAPWVAADGSHGAILMTQQAAGVILPSEALKAQLDPLIRAALAQNPPVLRQVP